MITTTTTGQCEIEDFNIQDLIPINKDTTD